MKFKKLIIGTLLLVCSNLCNAYVWISAVPTSVRMVDGGLVLTGNFDLTGISCATANAIYLPGTDKQFDQKLSLALTAFTSGKAIKVLINDPISTNCTIVSANGSVPIVYSDYWYLINS